MYIQEAQVFFFFFFFTLSPYLLTFATDFSGSAVYDFRSTGPSPPCSDSCPSSDEDTCIAAGGHSGAVGTTAIIDAYENMEEHIDR